MYKNVRNCEGAIIIPDAWVLWCIKRRPTPERRRPSMVANVLGKIPQ